MVRSERDVLDATRAHATESPTVSWGHTVFAFALLAVSTWGALVLRPLPARVACSVLEGLTLVRVFILFHDVQHGALHRRSTAARLLYGCYGLLVLTPPEVWRRTHNYHHAHNGKIVGSHIGSYPVASVALWTTMSRGERLGYRAARHPLTMALGVFTVFGWGMCVAPFLRDRRRKNLVGPLAIALHAALLLAIVHSIGTHRAPPDLRLSCERWRRPSLRAGPGARLHGWSPWSC